MESFKRKYFTILGVEIILQIGITILTVYLYYLTFSDLFYLIFAIGSTLLMIVWFTGFFSKNEVHKVEIADESISFLNLIDNTKKEYKIGDIKSYNSKIRVKEKFVSLPNENPYLYFEVEFNDGFCYCATQQSTEGFWEIKKWIEEKRLRNTES